jgi:hypothetical protein
LSESYHWEKARWKIGHGCSCTFETLNPLIWDPNHRGFVHKPDEKIVLTNLGLKHMRNLRHAKILKHIAESQFVFGIEVWCFVWGFSNHPPIDVLWLYLQAYLTGVWFIFVVVYSYVLQILTFLQFGGYTLVRNSTDLFRSFGFDTQPVLIGLIIFQVLLIWKQLLYGGMEMHAFFFPGRGAVVCHINFWLLSQSVGFMSLALYLQHTVIPLQHLVSFGLNLVSRAFEFQVLSPPPPFVCISKSWSHLM